MGRTSVSCGTYNATEKQDGIPVHVPASSLSDSRHIRDSVELYWLHKGLYNQDKQICHYIT